jgi:ubiquinone/menaquinone biosynthesis C-methylase UbiE
MSFDLLAPHYRWMEFALAGEKLQRCRTAFIDEVPVPSSILLVGEGHGRCLLECCRRFPAAEVICVDASGRMLAEARHRLSREKQSPTRVEFIQADILGWSPPASSFDLIVTNFFLDCFREEQLARIVSRIAAAAVPDASWLLADFQIPSEGLKRIRGRLILWTMYAFFRAVTRLPAKRLISPDVFLKEAGFMLQGRVVTEWGLLHSDWWRGRRTIRRESLIESDRVGEIG